MGFLRNFGLNLMPAVNSMRGNHPEQEVHSDDGVNLLALLAMGVKEKLISKEIALALAESRKRNESAADLMTKRIENGITLDKTDDPNFRNDATMDSITKDVSVDEKKASGKSSKKEREERIIGE